MFLSAAMTIPTILDYYDKHQNFESFIVGAFITAFFGASIFLANRQSEESEQQRLNIKTAFLLTSITWLCLAFFASIPLYLSAIGEGYTDAFFEAMSALTTTGATVITDLQQQSRGVLFWRATLQWFGGIGIIVMAMSILPLLKIGGMQLFRTESSDKADKVLPRATQIAGAITSIYLSFTIVCAIMMWSIAGIGWFDAITHAMTTVATGGFSNYDTSIGYFDNIRMEILMIIFMLVSALPYVVYIQMVGGRAKSAFNDSQVKLFLAIVIISVLLATIWLRLEFDIGFLDALRMAAFNIVSIATTSGFATSDYYHWGSFMVIFVYLLCVMGGCTGSTTGGIKVFRYHVLLENAKAQVYRLIQPHGVFRPKFNEQPISDEATASVVSYIILFAICFSAVALLLSITGLDYTTSMSAAAAMLANLGPGLGDTIGPAGNYSNLTDFAKWVCTIAMLVGRLEIFTVLVLLTPYFWRN
jgi:trk system potassium uptake protein TrkH